MVKKYKIHLIAATRPNFVKIAPLYLELLKRSWAEPIIVHTGQHYDASLSKTIFPDLLLPKPHFNLGIGSGTHAEQTGKVMMAYEKVLFKHQPNLMVVVGDVNATLAAAMATVKLDIKIAHLQAGLPSFDRTRPEEINRIITDTVVDLWWTPSRDADENLRKMGVPHEKIRCNGNIMIDALEMMRTKIVALDTWQDLGLVEKNYAVVTLHRPSNVDRQSTLTPIVEALCDLAVKLPIVFLVHPRTQANLERFDLLDRLASSRRIHCLAPQSYLRFMSLIFNCRLVVIDSGGIQEETTYLGILCITVRDCTERPITIAQGTSRLCSVQSLRPTIKLVMQTKNKKFEPPQGWDGKTAGRIADDIAQFFCQDTANNFPPVAGPPFVEISNKVRRQPT